MVTLGSLLVILTFCFQPLSAALFSVQDVWWMEPRAHYTFYASRVNRTQEVLTRADCRDEYDEPCGDWIEPGL
jgi:hypothetical protein